MEKKRKYIVIRKHKDFVKNDIGKNLTLSFDVFYVKDYKYFCFVTNSSEHPYELWKILRHRSDDENRFKELKIDYAFKELNVNSFYGTETCMLLQMLLFNIIRLFKINFLNKKEKNEFLSTFRRKYLILPALLNSGSNLYALKISVYTKNLKSKIIHIRNMINRFKFNNLSNAMH
jgi:hypothetical protein